MPTKNERYQAAWHQYEATQEHLPSSLKQAAKWAVSQGLVDLPKIDPFEVLASQMANALREEIQTDHKGRRFRVNHAVRITKGGVQYTMWAILNYAPHDHMEKAFGQRREQIIGDCVQLATDVDVYNDMHKGERPMVQMVLDFTDDVAERLVTAA